MVYSFDIYGTPAQLVAQANQYCDANGLDALDPTIRPAIIATIEAKATDKQARYKFGCTGCTENTMNRDTYCLPCSALGVDCP